MPFSAGWSGSGNPLFNEGTRKWLKSKSKSVAMKLRPEQLNAHLDKGLAAVYMVYGDEPLTLQETTDAIRAAARARGYSERVCLTVETGFNWNSLLQMSANLSLFATCRLLELRLGSAKPGETGGKILQAYAERPAVDTVLLLTAGKLDANTQQSRWFTALDAAGVSIQARPLEAKQLPAWVARRMGTWGLRPTPEATALLVERVEGNLLAASQEIQKLHMLFGAGSISAEQVLAAVSDSARYSVYDLVDAALEGQAERTVRILNGLRGEGVEAILVAWALHREICLLAVLSFTLGQGQALEMVLARQGVWEKRKPLVRQALKRLSLSQCWQLVRHCARLERVIKGAEVGNPWDELLNLSLSLAGLPLLARVDREA